jgi:triosephosphate isomerase (TIM)
MKKMLIAGNWKMNTNVVQSKKLCEDLLVGLTQMNSLKSKVLVCPPFTNIQIVSDTLKNSVILYGAQNCYYEPQGAFTGEISIPMLSHLGCTYIIIGHSERRAYFSETDEAINKKVIAILNSGITPIMCIGETLEERQSNSTFSVLERQLTIGLNNITPDKISDIVIAYEPVWAIGTGIAATTEQVHEAHTWIRNYLTEKFGQFGQSVILLYGGSLNSENADTLLKLDDVNGGLIGGASLKPDVFLSIIKTAESII